MEQGSQEWLKARMGVITASRFKDVLRSKRSKSITYGKTRETLLCELVAQAVTMELPELSTPAIDHGKEYEPEARSIYELTTGLQVEEVGLTISKLHNRVGASPDGLVQVCINSPYTGQCDEWMAGGIEIKCPGTKKHIWTLRNGVPEEHIPQIQGNIWVHDVEFWDFISYDPRLPPGSNLFIQRLERDEEYIEKLSEDVLSFADELEIQINKIIGI